MTQHDSIKCMENMPILQPTAPVAPLQTTAEIKVEYPDIPQAAPQEPTLQSKNTSPLVIIGGISIALLTIVVGVFAYLAMQQNNIDNHVVIEPTTFDAPQAVIPTPVEITPSIEETPLYANAEQGYQFEYPATWTTTQQGTLTTLIDSSSENFANCQQSATIPELECAEVLISSLHYAGTASTAPGVAIVEQPDTPTPAEQVADLANQFGVAAVIPSNTALLSGYVAISTTGDGSTLSVVLQGEKGMLLAQFIKKMSLDELSDNQKRILNSLQEY